MQPVVETVSGLERRVDLIVSAADIEKEVQTQLKRVARTAKVQGFRPGKAPLSLIERSHGPGVRYDVLNAEIGRALDKVIQETELRIAGTPDLEPKPDHPNEEELAFTATFEVYPQIELPDLSTLEVTQAQTSVDDNEVKQTIEVLRKQRATYEAEAERAAQDSDRVTLDFTGTIEGVAFEGGTASDFSFVLGEGRMLPEFETAVQGMKAGESKTFPLNFPEDYGGEAVAGKEAEFAITIKEVAKAVLPEIDSEFVKTLGQSEGDVEKFFADVKANIEREVKARTLARTKNSVMDALVKASSFDVPKSLVEAETQARIQAAREELKQRGMPNADTIDFPADAFKDEAERRVRLGLLLSELVQANDLSAKPEQVRARIEEFAKNYEQPEQVIAYYLSDRQRRSEIEAIVLEDNVVEQVLSQAKITNEDVSFDDIMGNN